MPNFAAGVALTGHSTTTPTTNSQEAPPRLFDAWHVGGEAGPMYPTVVSTTSLVRPEIFLKAELWCPPSAANHSECPPCSQPLSQSSKARNKPSADCQGEHISDLGQQHHL